MPKQTTSRRTPGLVSTTTLAAAKLLGGSPRRTGTLIPILKRFWHGSPRRLRSYETSARAADGARSRPTKACHALGVVEPAERRTAWSHVAIVIDFLIGAIALGGALFLDLHLVAPGSSSDLVALRGSMPEQDGFAARRTTRDRARIRKLLGRPHTPLVAWTTGHRYRRGALRLRGERGGTRLRAVKPVVRSMCRASP